MIRSRSKQQVANDKFLEYFLKFFEGRGQWAAETISGYRSDMKRFFNYLENQKIDLAKITPTTYRNYHIFLLKNRYSKSTVYKSAGLVRIFYGWLATMGIIDINVGLLSIPKNWQPIMSFDRSPKQLAVFDGILMNTLIYSRSEITVIIFDILRFTGMKTTELINLRVGDLQKDREFILITVRSYKSSRVVPILVENLSSCTINYLISRIETENKNAPLLVNKMGSKMNRREIYSSVRSILEENLEHKGPKHLRDIILAKWQLQANLTKVMKITGQRGDSLSRLVVRRTENLKKIFDHCHPKGANRKKPLA